MKKLLVGILAALILALAVITAVGCGKTSSSAGRFDELSGTDQVYGFSAASAATVISAMNGGQAAGVAAKKGMTTFRDGQTAAVTDEQTVNELNGYMMLVESLLSDGGFGFTESASDLPDYEKMMRVTYRDLPGNTIEYVMYYNETVIHEETEWDDGEEERETTSRIDGILRIDGADYAMRGVSENSSEGDETESEHELTVTLGANAYLLVEQEVEQERGENEQEYAYSLYENKTLIERSLFEYEQELGETEIKLEQRVRGENGSYTTQIFYFDRETEHGRDTIRIRVGDRNAAAAYTVSIQENADGTFSYLYEQANGGRFTRERD